MCIEYRIHLLNTVAPDSVKVKTKHVTENKCLCAEKSIMTRKMIKETAHITLFVFIQGLIYAEAIKQKNTGHHYIYIHVHVYRNTPRIQYKVR